MEPQDDTVHDTLTYPNPNVNIVSEDKANTQNSENSNYKARDLAHVTPWEDFNYENIKAAYGDFLDSTIAYHDNTKPSQIDYPPSQQEITNETGVDYLINFWSARVIRSNMKYCSNLIRQRLGLPAAMPSFQQKGRRLRNPYNIKGEFEPDWEVAVPPNGQIFVMGESKVSAKWIV
ncbi:hypothetical protein V8F33_004989 [Rhypophila sp. PSN 637]